MATHRIVLLISDEEIAALVDLETVLNNVAEMGEMNDDYSDEVEHVNDLYAYLTGINARISIEVQS
jgi:hypothetical protein